MKRGHVAHPKGAKDFYPEPSKPKATPGPLAIYCNTVKCVYEIYSPNKNPLGPHETVAEIPYPFQGDNRKEHANAVLLAAAPDLLEAAKEVSSSFHRFIGTPRKWGPDRAALEGFIAQLDKAISKATGA